MRASEFLNETQELDEIERLYPDDYAGGKQYLYDKQYGKQVKKLPGGSGLLYSTSGGRWGGIDIKLWDPKGQDYIMAKTMAGRPEPVKQRGESKYSYIDRLQDWKRLQQTIMAPGQLIGKLSVIGADEFPLKRAVQVNSITVDEDYRGMSLAKALYGIVLTIMKRPLLAGTSQTPGGRRNWVSLANIPGVQMKGYVSIDEGDLEPIKPDSDDDRWDAEHKKEHNRDVDKNIDTIMGKLGGQHIGRNSYGNDVFAFDVRPNATGKELEAAVKTKLSQVYGNYESNTGLYAIWSGQ
jgi:GNAT superfamily N-acetyltransferase